MFTEFIAQPTSGEYEEKLFDIDTPWKSPNWSWVKFLTDNGVEWVGVFRGSPLKMASADQINQVAILTDTAIYILDMIKRELLYHDAHTEIRDLISVPALDQFLTADFYQVYLLDSNFEYHILETQYEMDYIEFKNYEGTKLGIETDIEIGKKYEKSRVGGYVDTTNWTIVLNTSEIIEK